MKKERKPNRLLRRERNLRGWSQGRLAEELNTTVEGISNWERGEKIPSKHHQEAMCVLFGKTAEELGFLETEEKELHISPASVNLLPHPDKQTMVASPDQAVVIYGSHIRVFALQNESQKSIPQWLLATSSHLVESSTNNEGASPSSDVPLEGTMEIDPDPGLEGEKTMDQQRREMLQVLKSLGLIGATTGIPMIGQQDLIAEVRGALQPSGPGDKELKYLEQRIRYYWQDRPNVTIAPADLMSYTTAYVREVTTLLKRSLMPSIRTRLCACLSQGMLLVGTNFHDLGQFQTAREYFQAALEAAHEANHNILQALAWRCTSYSWMRSNETDRYERALDGMLKASGFASLESDLTVQCSIQAGSAEVYAHLKNKVACIEALKQASRLGGHGSGDWYFMEPFDHLYLNGYRGLCLQQLYRSGDPDANSLLEDARQALEEGLSQPNVVELERAFLVVDMAQLHARKGEVEFACDYARQIISIAGASAPLQQRLLTVRTHLEPYADVQAVRDLDTEIRALSLPGKQ